MQKKINYEKEYYKKSEMFKRSGKCHNGLMIIFPLLALLISEKK